MYTTQGVGCTDSVKCVGGPLIFKVGHLMRHLMQPLPDVKIILRLEKIVKAGVKVATNQV